MTKLPPEVLHKIFIQLDLYQRLKCLTVCRSWWHVLDKGALFYNFMIQHYSQLNRFMDHFERLDNYAAQVQEICIMGLSNVKLNERNLLKTFPNVRIIDLSNQWVSLNYTFPCTKKDNRFFYSKSKLEYLSDYDQCTLASQMLSLNLGDRLETLELRFGALPICGTILRQLKNLPVLKNLYLERAHIKIHDLEDIHNNIPFIQNLSLTNVTILASSMPANVVPATSVTKLEFKYRRYQDAVTGAQMYQYLTKKYTNISSVEYTDDNLHNYSSNERKYIYSNGALHFLKMIGSKQDVLFLNGLPDDVDPFEALDAGHAEIKYVYISNCESKTIFQYLRQSKQCKYIKALYIFDTIVDLMHPLQNMAALNVLTIEYQGIYSPRIHLADCLAACPPALESLTIRNVTLAPAPFTMKLESIKSISIETVSITHDVGDIISNCLPNLVNLELIGVVKEDIFITLNNPDFHTANFWIGERNEDMDAKYGFAFKCPNISETLHYICSHEEVNPASIEDIRGLPLLSVEYPIERELEVGSSIYIR